MSLSLLLKNITSIITLWREIRRQRQALLALDDHLLDDIGISREQAWREAHRPSREIFSFRKKIRPAKSLGVASSNPRFC
ncbi:MAG: DUF1127 domain-containing protein [Desulfuromonadaceae bacterium]|nr:DUF1127 domain-containing protein [Desulfuromonadaceae bacterium]